MAKARRFDLQSPRWAESIQRGSGGIAADPQHIDKLIATAEFYGVDPAFIKYSAIYSPKTRSITLLSATCRARVAWLQRQVEAAADQLGK